MRRGRPAQIESYGSKEQAVLLDPLEYKLLLGVSRFELMERFERLGVPVRIGPAG